MPGCIRNNSKDPDVSTGDGMSLMRPQEYPDMNTPISAQSSDSCEIWRAEGKIMAEIAVNLIIRRIQH